MRFKRGQRVKSNCLECGKRISYTFWNQPRKYCSWACSIRASRRRCGKSVGIFRKGQRVRAKCEFCKRLFQYTYDHKGRRYCGPSCRRRAYYQRYHDRIRAQRSAKRLAHRKELIAAYGGRCACCGETRIEFLEIDHIDGGGNAHLREIGGHEKLMGWLKRRGYPKAGFRLLCRNCNGARGFYGYCPHERERKK